MLKNTVLYICDPSRAKDCDQIGCRLGMCKCTSRPDWAALDKDGKPIATTMVEIEVPDEEE